MQIYIRRCVDSILAQTLTSFELILVDDGSSDECSFICDEYASKDSRVRTFHQKNAGQAAARNLALQYATAEWICFVDSDDMIHPYMLEYLYRGAEDYQADMSMCQYEEGNEPSDNFCNSVKYESYYENIDEDKMSSLMAESKYYWIVYAKLIKKSIIQSEPFTPGRCYEDNAVACKWIYIAESISVVPLSLYFYQINQNGTTKGKFSLKHLDFLWAMEQQVRFYKTVGHKRMAKKTLIYYLRSFRAYYIKVKNLDDSWLIRKNMTINAIRLLLNYIVSDNSGNETEKPMEFE